MDASSCLEELEELIGKNKKSFVQVWDEMKENNELDSTLKNLVSHFLTNNIESWNLEPAEKKMFSGCLRKGLENWVENRILLLRTSLCGEGNDFLIGLVLANVPLLGS